MNNLENILKEEDLKIRSLIIPSTVNLGPVKLKAILTVLDTLDYTTLKTI